LSVGPAIFAGWMLFIGFSSFFAFLNEPRVHQETFGGSISLFILLGLQLASD
jgi:hypothetical protein